MISVIDYIYPHLSLKPFFIYFICNISKPFPDNHFIPLSSFQWQQLSWQQAQNVVNDKSLPDEAVSFTQSISSSHRMF